MRKWRASLSADTGSMSKNNLKDPGPDWGQTPIFSRESFSNGHIRITGDTVDSYAAGKSVSDTPINVQGVCLAGESICRIHNTR